MGDESQPPSDEDGIKAISRNAYELARSLGIAAIASELLVKHWDEISRLVKPTGDP